jgi:hypothetical protein
MSGFSIAPMSVSDGPLDEKEATYGAWADSDIADFSMVMVRAPGAAAAYAARIGAPSVWETWTVGTEWSCGAGLGLEWVGFSLVGAGGLQSAEGACQMMTASRSQPDSKG